MITPVRIQLSRKKGFRLQDVSMALNGLPAVSVARGPGRKYGNPWVVKKIGDMWAVDDPPFYQRGPYSEQGICRDWFCTKEAAKKDAVNKFKLWTDTPIFNRDYSGLEGKNVACICGPDETCHGDILLELANK